MFSNAAAQIMIYNCSYTETEFLNKPIFPGINWWLHCHIKIDRSFRHFCWMRRTNTVGITSIRWTILWMYWEF